MLISISIKNFAIVRQLEVNWHSQMTTITGETGAGKSIAIDALAQSLGERSDANMVRAGADKAEIITEFDVTNLSSAKKWLQEQDLLSEQDCILRRVISKEGRSQAYINGTKVPAAQLKSLGTLLVSIHGQHAHQLLTRADHQCYLLDQYAGNQTILDKVKSSYLCWQNKLKQFNELNSKQLEFSAQQQLLKYQVEELDNADIFEGEYQQVEQEHKRLHHAKSLLSDCQQSLDILTENESGNAYSAIRTALSVLYKSAELDRHISPAVDLLDSALIQLEEGASELRRYTDALDLNPERLQEVEDRLNLLVDLARKHHIQPEQLAEQHKNLINELKDLTHSDEHLLILEKEIEQEQHTYGRLCEELTKSRTNFAVELNEKITASMTELNMAGAQFKIDIKTDLSFANMSGADKIEFLVSANPGQPLQPLSKVASGGELSRISLAIQVIIAQRVTTPTLMFDEVDVGVSGPTATAVGKLMNKLSNNTQVICVTHLPQVACFGHQQQFVNKVTDNNETETNMQALDQIGRIDELARLLGGDQISSTTKANAQELLSIAHAH